ncbi:MAG: zinc ribbon domain-containing protein [Verrucomicrobiales bacterium]|jgi:putative FmdB family regulatory protein
MPLYEYQCTNHGLFEDFVSLESRNEAVPCPDCGTLSSRVVSTPRLRTLSPLSRMASERNERSRHEPRVGGPAPCKGHKNAKPTADGRRMRQAYQGARPWVIEHQ